MKKYSYLVIGLLIFAPIFITYGADGAFSLNRTEVASYQMRMRTLPLSLFLATLIALLNIKKIIFNKYLLIYGAYILICIIGYSLVDRPTGEIFADNDARTSLNPGLIYLAFQSGQFLVFLIAFRIYFEKLLIKINPDVLERLCIIYPFLVVSLVVFANTFFSPEQGDVSLFTEKIKIFNFMQYYAFFHVLLLGIVSRFKVRYFLIFFLISVYISIISSNLTALSLNIIFLIFYILHNFAGKFKDLLFNYFSYILVLFFVFAPFILVLISFIAPQLFLYHEETFQSFTSGFLIDNRTYGMGTRLTAIKIFYSNLEWYSVIFPFLNSGNINSSWHNQLVVIFGAFGVIGVILYYYIFLKFTMFDKNYGFVKISIFLVVFLGGIVVLPQMHFYLSVIIAYITTFYFSVSKSIKNEKNPNP